MVVPLGVWKETETIRGSCMSSAQSQGRRAVPKQRRELGRAGAGMYKACEMTRHAR